MDELIVRELSGSITDIEARSLQRWRDASVENEDEYRVTCALWALTAEESEARGGRAPDPDTVISVAAVRRRRARAREGRRAALRSPWLAYGLAAAAVLVLSLARWGPAGSSAAPSLSAVESTASAGDVTTLALSDGSVVRLARSSTIEFPPFDGRREAVLRGRAFFAVASGGQPFVVRSEVADVTVVGTRFEVSSSPDAVRLVVVEGTVSLTADGRVLEVPAGSAAYVERGGAPRLDVDVDVWALLDWDGGLLVFQDTPLGAVSRELGLAFGVDIEVDPDIADRRVTAWFADEPLEDVVSAICLVAGTSCEARPGSISIGR